MITRPHFGDLVDFWSRGLGKVGGGLGDEWPKTSHVYFSITTTSPFGRDPGTCSPQLANENTWYLFQTNLGVYCSFELIIVKAVVFQTNIGLY